MLTAHDAQSTEAAMAVEGITPKKVAFRTGAIAAIIAVVAIILTASVGATIAYFTAATTAKASIETSFSELTSIQEVYKDDIVDWTMPFSVTNDDDSHREVYVRAKAFNGSKYDMTCSNPVGGAQNWVLGSDGYYYYGSVVPATLDGQAIYRNGIILGVGQSTSTLTVRMIGIDASIPAPVGESFKVGVVYETTPVLYDASGNPYADWSYTLDNGTSAEGGE